MPLIVAAARVSAQHIDVIRSCRSGLHLFATHLSGFADGLMDCTRRASALVSRVHTPARAWNCARDPWKNGRTMLHSIAERLFSFTVIGPCRTCSPAQILDILTLQMSSTSSLICRQHGVCQSLTGAIDTSPECCLPFYLQEDHARSFAAREHMYLEHVCAKAVLRLCKEHFCYLQVMERHRLKHSCGALLLIKYPCTGRD